MKVSIASRSAFSLAEPCLKAGAGLLSAQLKRVGPTQPLFNFLLSFDLILLDVDLAINLIRQLIRCP